MIDLNQLTKMTEEELIQLNRAVVSQINHIRNRKNSIVKEQINIGSKVIINSKKQGRKIKGIVKKINRKTIDVQTTDLSMYRVSPTLLECIE